MESRNCYELVSPIAPNTFDKDLGWYERLQLTKPLAAADCHRLNTYLEQQPETLLRIYPQKETGSIGYGFLGRLPALRNLWLEANSGELIDLSGLSELPKRLKTLTLDTVASYSDPKLDRPKRSVEVLEMLTELEEFSFCGRLKDLRFLRGLGGLRELSLWRNKLVSLVGIEACTELRDLEITASGIKELDPVQSLVTLEFLEISRHSQLSKLEPIVRLPKLRQLRLLGCKINVHHKV